MAFPALRDGSKQIAADAMEKAVDRAVDRAFDRLPQVAPQIVTAVLQDKQAYDALAQFLASDDVRSAVNTAANGVARQALGKINFWEALVLEFVEAQYGLSNEALRSIRSSQKKYLDIGWERIEPEIVEPAPKTVPTKTAPAPKKAAGGGTSIW